MIKRKHAYTVIAGIAIAIFLAFAVFNYSGGYKPYPYPTANYKLSQIIPNGAYNADVTVSAYHLQASSTSKGELIGSTHWYGYLELKDGTCSQDISVVSISPHGETSAGTLSIKQAFGQEAYAKVLDFKYLPAGIIKPDTQWHILRYSYAKWLKPVGLEANYWEPYFDANASRNAFSEGLCLLNILPNTTTLGQAGSLISTQVAKTDWIKASNSHYYSDLFKNLGLSNHNAKNLIDTLTTLSTPNLVANENSVIKIKHLSSGVITLTWTSLKDNVDDVTLSLTPTNTKTVVSPSTLTLKALVLSDRNRWLN